MNPHINNCVACAPPQVVVSATGAGEVVSARAGEVAPGGRWGQGLGLNPSPRTAQRQQITHAWFWQRRTPLLADQGELPTAQ